MRALTISRNSSGALLAHWESNLLADPPVGSLGLLDGHCSCCAKWRCRGTLGRGGGDLGAPGWVPTLGPLQRKVFVCLCPGDPAPATTGAPEAFCGATSVRRGSGTQGANPGAPTAQRRCSSAARGSSTSGAPQAPCGKERASCTRKRSKAGCGRPEDGGVGAAKTVKRPPQQPAQSQHANYWAPLGLWGGQVTPLWCGVWAGGPLSPPPPPQEMLSC